MANVYRLGKLVGEGSGGEGGGDIEPGDIVLFYEDFEPGTYNPALWELYPEDAATVAEGELTFGVPMDYEDTPYASRLATYVTTTGRPGRLAIKYSWEDREEPNEFDNATLWFGLSKEGYSIGAEVQRMEIFLSGSIKDRIEIAPPGYSNASDMVYAGATFNIPTVANTTYTAVFHWRTLSTGEGELLVAFDGEILVGPNIVPEPAWTAWMAKPFDVYLNLAIESGDGRLFHVKSVLLAERLPG
jgi:hypothetical protein